MGFRRFFFGGRKSSEAPRSWEMLKPHLGFFCNDVVANLVFSVIWWEFTTRLVFFSYYTAHLFFIQLFGCKSTFFEIGYKSEFFHLLHISRFILHVGQKAIDVGRAFWRFFGGMFQSWNNLQFQNPSKNPQDVFVKDISRNRSSFSSKITRAIPV